MAAVRAHGILGDDLGTYREVDGRPVHDFAGIDRVYDRLLGIGLRPVVELAYMPRDLARDPDHLGLLLQGGVVAAQGLGPLGGPGPRPGPAPGRPLRADEVRDHWAFEVWNEPNLEYFWSGDAADYLRLYDTAARAVRSVDPGLRVGGRPRPRSAGSRTWSPTPRRPAPRWTSSPPTCTAARRSTCAQPFTATAARTRPSGGPSGGPTRGCPTRWPSRCTRPRSWPGGCARPPAGSTPCPGGSPPTTSRSWAGRPRCCTAGSGC